MKAKLLKSNNPHAWQNDFVGEVVEVYKEKSFLHGHYIYTVDLNNEENKHIRKIQKNWCFLYVDESAINLIK